MPGLVEFDIAMVQDLAAEANKIASEIQKNGAVTLRGVVPIPLVDEMRAALAAVMEKMLHSTVTPTRIPEWSML